MIFGLFFKKVAFSLPICYNRFKIVFKVFCAFLQFHYNEEQARSQYDFAMEYFHKLPFSEEETRRENRQRKLRIDP